ncbi:unnamed protein product, partial [Pocillopora meandrina]
QVNVPKQRRTYCKGKNCRRHTLHKVTQYKKEKIVFTLRENAVTIVNSQAMVVKRNPFSTKRPKQQRKLFSIMECTDCKYRKQIALKRCKHFELGGDKKRKGQMIQF